MLPWTEGRIQARAADREQRIDAKRPRVLRQTARAAYEERMAPIRKARKAARERQAAGLRRLTPAKAAGQ